METHGVSLSLYLTHLGLMECCPESARPEVSVEVAGDTIEGGAVDAIGCDVDRDHLIRVYTEVVCRLGPGGDVVRQHHNPVVGAAESDLVLCADHTEGVLPAHTALLDRKGLLAIVECAAYGGYHDGLSGSDVGRPADDLQRSVRAVLATEIHRGDVEVVRVGVRDTGEDLPDDETAQSATDRLTRLHAV